ncbi:sensor histidine kinase [Hyalangium sp.]|uniref:sensor histidine kinase n=1 Tax=Hyalangium sp. TaxID=2028555 RepID=UPI00389A3650
MTPAIPLSEELFQARHQPLLRAILDNMSEGVSILEATGQFVYVSAFDRKVFAVGESMSAPPSEWASRHGIFRPDEHTLFPGEEMPLSKAIRGEEARDVDMFVRNANFPQGLHIRCTCLPVRDEQGKLLGAMSLTRDIDAQYKSEAEKRRTEASFRLLVDTAQEGIWTVDPTWHTTYVNRYLAQLLGYSVEEMLGKHLFTFLPEEGQRHARSLLEPGPNAPAVEVHDRKFLRRDGTVLWTTISTTPMIDEQGRYLGALAMITDITQRREAEEQVRRLNAELEQRIAERTAQLEYSNHELEAFAYTVAHDLRSPLRSIASFSDALLEDCAGQLDAVGEDYLRRIIGGSKRMSELIDGILALSRVNSTQLVCRPCDLSAMASSIVEQLQGLQPERAVKLNVQPGLVEEGDPHLLRSVLENLLSNAWKFTRERPVAEIELSATQDERGVRTYVVRDNGAGFDMAYGDKLFGVFQRLHAQAEFEGNGVGLATVQRIIRRHGGRIWGEGQPGEGARFFFTLNELPRPPRTTAQASGR